MIGKHFSRAHGGTSLLKESQFGILKKCQGKFHCLVYKMLFIKEHNLGLNTRRRRRRHHRRRRRRRRRRLLLLLIIIIIMLTSLDSSFRYF